MLRRIIKINEEKCNGCGLCAKACHEGAIEMIGGKAKLTKENYCDGLGDCLPACPMDAITFEEREAPAYDEAAVLAAKKKKEILDSIKNDVKKTDVRPVMGGCPGKLARAIERKADNSSCAESKMRQASQLRNWPVQIKLAPVNAEYFDDANLLIAADCTAYTYGNFHNDFIRNRVVLMGCPMLDQTDYIEKLTHIIAANNIKSVTVVRMQVPCCGGVEHAVKTALQNSGKFIPWQIVTISVDGEIVD